MRTRFEIRGIAHYTDAHDPNMRGAIALGYEQFDIRARLRNELNSYVEMTRLGLIQATWEDKCSIAKRMMKKVSYSYGRKKEKMVAGDGSFEMLFRTEEERKEDVAIWLRAAARIQPLSFFFDLPLRKGACLCCLSVSLFQKIFLPGPSLIRYIPFFWNWLSVETITFRDSIVMERLLPVVLLLTFSSGGLSRSTVDGNWDSCDERLERALDALHRDSARRNRLEEEGANTIYQQKLRSAPLEMSVNRIAVKLPQGARDTGSHWARVERCMFEPGNNSLQSRVIFNDLSVSGMVSLMPRDHQPPTLAESCRMTLRLRRAGIDFMTSPIARGRGQMRIRTESSFLEPKFASIYAYGCHPTRLDKQIKRQDKWPPFYPPRDAYGMLSLTTNDNYEAAEPRQLVGVSKEVDVVIPNESRQARFLHSPVAKLGIWRKNVWVTKLPLRERRSSEPFLRLEHPTNSTGHSLDRSAKAREDPSDSLPRTLRSTATITPQDFTMALTSKRTNANLDSDRSLPVNETSLHKVILAETTEGLLENSNNNEQKTNFKRENGSKRTIHQDSRETRELYLGENLDDAFPTELDNISRNWQSKEDIAREMEDVFLHGASQALTRYIERQLHPAIKETLMLSMGYTISYG